MKRITILGLLLWFSSQKAWAEWDVSRLRILDDACFIDHTEVEDSKLTVRFSRFSAELERAARVESFPSVVQCAVAVGFKLPPQRRLVSLTHRVFAYVNKTAASRVLMRVSMALNDEAFTFAGVLPEDSVVDQRLLLYKSFIPSNSLTVCNSEETELDVTLSWESSIEATAAGGRAKLNLVGDDLWTDFWIETSPCHESAHSPALGDAYIR